MVFQLFVFLTYQLQLFVYIHHVHTVIHGAIVITTAKLHHLRQKLHSIQVQILVEVFDGESLQE